MLYLKHPEFGCRHVADAEAAALEADGWTRFPRSREAKAAGPWPPVNTAPAVTLESVRALLDELGIKYDRRVKDVAKLQALLP